MHAYSISPSGVLSHLPLAGMTYRLELGATTTQLGVGLRYVAGSNVPLMFLCSLDIGLEAGDALKKIAKIGLPKATKEANLERLRESMKMLHNSNVKSAFVDGYIKQSESLVKCYYDCFEAIRMQGTAKGTAEGWKWIIQQDAHGWEIPTEPEE